MPTFLLTPWLFAAGLAAVAVPILIHILNKRRFRRVDWGAMEFLLKAQKINRRRIRLEELLLLLMRCAIMALIGLLLARPFLSFEQGAGLFGSARHERIIVLDDSLSMNGQAGGATPMMEARKTITEWVSTLATSHPNDGVTLLLASNPERPALYETLQGDTSSRLLDDIKKLASADQPADLPKALAEVERLVTGASPTQANRIVYLLTDLRARDWERGKNAEADLGERLKRIADKASGCYLVDLGRAAGENLAIEEISATDKALIAGVPTAFEVRVRNHGAAVANDVRVKFGPTDSLALNGVIDRIAPGETGSVPFTYTFAAPQNNAVPEPEHLQATLENEDALPDDNIRYFPARLVAGLPVLIVDGDPSAKTIESESFFLRKALAPKGRSASGINVTVVDETEFETTDLAGYQAVFLANLYRVSEARKTSLAEWVKSGGGLIVGLGGQVDEESYNTELHQNGQGFLPVELEGIEGDETREKWVYFEPTKINHPVLRPFEGENVALLENVKVFRRWLLKVPAEAEQLGRATVLMRFTNETKSPALVESAFGEGRVLVLATALDADWSNWPVEAASYLITLQEITRRAAKGLASDGSVDVGQPMQVDLDLTKYRPETSLRLPSGANAAVRAVPPKGAPNATVWPATFEEATRRGFYEWQLTGTSGDAASKTLFAANIQASEGQLARADESALRGQLAGAKVALVKAGAALGDLGANATRSEFWRWVLYALLAFLCLELFYGWRLGATR